MHKYLQQFQGRTLASRQTLQFSQQVQEQFERELRTVKSYGFDQLLLVPALSRLSLHISIVPVLKSLVTANIWLLKATWKV